MFAYGKFNDGQMDDFVPSDAEIAEALKTLPKI